MNILLTNDDGIHFPGITALCNALKIEHDLLTVAPAQDLTEALFRGDTVTAADIIDFDIREELDRFIEATIG